MEFLEEFRCSANGMPVHGKVGLLRGYSSQTVVADLDWQNDCDGTPWGDGSLVVKFEIYPGQISRERLTAELCSEQFARRYLDRFMPMTLRIIGHGMRNAPSALVYQTRVPGKLLRKVSEREIRSNPRLRANLIEFCDRVWAMGKETGRIPDIAGTLPRVDHLTNFFWWSRNVMVDSATGGVWLVDTGWKAGQEQLTSGPLRPRLRTWVRLLSLRLFRWWIGWGRS